jgi:protein-S-isoprenylcysteine O-methyltransferase Ste14
MPSDVSSQVLTTFTGSPRTSLAAFAPSWSWAAGTGIAIAGGLFRLRAFRELGRHFTFQLGVLKDHELLTTGPFALVRHPSYIGLFGLLWGGVLATVAPGSWVREVLLDGALAHGFASGPWWVPYARALAAWAFTSRVIITIGTFVRIPREDAMLRRAFGKQWDDWAMRTPYRLVPGVY